VESLPLSKRYIDGPAGAGKTTVGIFRALELIENGADPGSILILVPQRKLGEPIRTQITLLATSGELPVIVTIAGLARRMVDLYWPMIAEGAGFDRPAELPRFLTLETAQYHMSRVVGPYLDEGYFESLNLDRYRLYRQILDNLNKAAVVGFPISEIGARLSEAWVGPEQQAFIYMQAQRCAEKFRAACYEENLIDYSLQYELFVNHVERVAAFRDDFADRYAHLIVDNVEEETPQGHDFISRWLPSFESVLIIEDLGGGYSRFLGADPEHARKLRETCAQIDHIDGTFVMSNEVMDFSVRLHDSINAKSAQPESAFGEAVLVHSSEYLPELLEWLVAEVGALIEQGVQASEIAIVSPFVSDSLRFLLTEKLDEKQIPWVSHRPSRAIADEAHNRCLLTFAALTYQGWKISPSREAVAQSLMIAIEGLDIVRATLLANTLYRPGGDTPELSPFQQLRPEMQERIGFVAGQKFDNLRAWIDQFNGSPHEHLDQFLGRLFGELLSQPGYGFHSQMDAGRAAAAMIASVQKFRAAADTGGSSHDELGREYYRLIHEGLLAAQYIARERSADEQAVLIAPAFTYLTMDQRSDVQFWMDIGNPAWAERLYQPLTHPYVLSRSWERGKPWTDEDEWRVRREIAATVTMGLSRRCRKKIYLCHSSYGEQGLKQQGILLNAVQRLLSGMITNDEPDDL
jgi:superfamily I DNA/RNA helicase